MTLVRYQYDAMAVGQTGSLDGAASWVSQFAIRGVSILVQYSNVCTHLIFLEERIDPLL